MVFMGSERYPEESAYSDHVSANGGFVNAYTEFEWTNYHYEINQSGLVKSLDMVASNMEASLLDQNAMEREINAVQSEFDICYTDDNTRSI